MKSFKDLTFQTIGKMRQAVLRFENGYGVSVIRGHGTISDMQHPFELAVIHFNNDESFSIVYPSFTNNDTIGYLDENGVSKYMEMTQSL